MKLSQLIVSALKTHLGPVYMPELHEPLVQLILRAIAPEFKRVQDQVKVMRSQRDTALRELDRLRQAELCRNTAVCNPATNKAAV